MAKKKVNGLLDWWSRCVSVLNWFVTYYCNSRVFPDGPVVTDNNTAAISSRKRLAMQQKIAAEKAIAEAVEKAAAEKAANDALATVTP